MSRLASIFTALSLLALAPVALAQEVEIERPAPPALDDFETDVNKDGIPDGWYNARDMKVIAEGGKVGPHALRFENPKPGRPARLSRAFGVDGRKTEALIVGAWVRLEQVQNGERLGEEPGLIMDFFGEGLRTLRRGSLGPWTKTVGSRWTHVTKRIPIPPGCRDVIMSVGLLGASGILEVDGLTFTLVPTDREETDNLVLNGDFELGDPTPFAWSLENGAHRMSPGFRTGATHDPSKAGSALELAKSGARALIGLSVPVEPFGSLSVSLAVYGKSLRGAGGAGAKMFFLDDDGQPLPGPDGGAEVFRWAGTFDWRVDRASVTVPQGAIRAVIQFEKLDNNGVVRIDNIAVNAAPNAQAGNWTPYHVETDTSGWLPVSPSPSIEPSSALDASFLLDAPAGKRGFVTVKNGRLAFAKGGRARFFGVYLLPPTPFQEAAKADALADRLARSGVNLVRLGDLETPLGPDRGLYDDSRDDTQSFDPVALAKLDHFIAALKSRGIYVALEFQAARRFRSGDEVPNEGSLPPGGGPAAEFNPQIGKLALKALKGLLEHVNPETGLALRDDPVLAWLTLAGEMSLFDLVDNPTALPSEYDAELHTLATKHTAGTGRRFWQTVGGDHWKGVADLLRKDHVRIPIAGVSHWRREPEFSAEQAGEGLDLIDDRLYWTPPMGLSPTRRSLLWSTDGGLAAGASRKRKPDKPYVVGQWCDQTRAAWAMAFEAADAILASEIASAEDWDALTRRGVFVHPAVWGSNSAGTGGVEDVYQIPEIVNGIPQVFALWPHAASLMLRGQRPAAAADAKSAAHRPSVRPRVATVPGWDPKRGRLSIDTPYTQGLAGWPTGESARFEQLTFDVDSTFAVVIASSANAKPIATTSRLLVSAIGRVEPTGFRWVDEWRRDVAEPGIPPLLREPVLARVVWKTKNKVQAFALDNTGARIGPAKLQEVDGGVQLSIDGSSPAFHWELVAE